MNKQIETVLFFFSIEKHRFSPVRPHQVGGDSFINEWIVAILLAAALIATTMTFLFITQKQKSTLALLKQQYSNLRMKHSDVEMRFEDVMKQNKALEKEKKNQSSPADAPSALLPLIMDIIRFRDQLLILKNHEDPHIQAIATGLYKEAGYLLRRHGVETLEGSGEKYNPHYQKVEEIRQTDNPALEEQVAETCKPGYRMEKEILRAQDVIVYKYET